MSEALLVCGLCLQVCSNRDPAFQIRSQKVHIACGAIILSNQNIQKFICRNFPRKVPNTITRKKGPVHGDLTSYFCTNLQTDATHDIELDTNLSPLKKKIKIIKRRVAMSLSEKLAILDWLKDEKSKGRKIEHCDVVDYISKNYGTTVSLTFVTILRKNEDKIRATSLTLYKSKYKRLQLGNVIFLRGL